MLRCLIILTLLVRSVSAQPTNFSGPAISDPNQTVVASTTSLIPTTVPTTTSSTTTTGTSTTTLVPPAAGSFFQPGLGPPSTSYSSPNVLAQDVTPSVAGLSMIGAYYLKPSGDSATRTFTLYKVSDQSSLGSVVTSGETASGWQYMAFTTPIPLTSGVTYRIAVTTGIIHYYNASFYGAAMTGVTMSSTGWYLNTATMAFPTIQNNNNWQSLDVKIQ